MSKKLYFVVLHLADVYRLVCIFDFCVKRWETIFDNVGIFNDPITFTDVILFFTEIKLWIFSEEKKCIYFFIF